MKIDYISDLHLDFHVKENHNLNKYKANTEAFLETLLPEDKGDVLIIAGDISHDIKQSVWVFEYFSELYERVFFTLGNHDYYLVSKNEKHKYGDSQGKVDTLLSAISNLDNVKLLLNYNVEKFNGVTFSGSTNWYDLTNQETLNFFSDNMNDSRLIKGFDIQKASYDESVAYEDLNSVDVIVTHVPPLVTNSHVKHGNSLCYLNKPIEYKAKHYVFGHVHEQFEYDDCGVKFHINTLGYSNEWTQWMDIMDYMPKQRKAFHEQWNTIKSFEV